MPHLVFPNSVADIWCGSYVYDVSERMPSRPPVPFTLTIKQGWFGRITGTVVEDETLGMPGVGSVIGRCWYPSIGFSKQMPVCYVARQEGGRISLREYLIEHGRECERDVPHRPIRYRGTFIDANHASGSWILMPGVIPLPDGGGVRVQEVAGSWATERAALP